MKDGDVVAGAFVRLLDDHDDFTAEVVTDSEGIFRFTAREGHWTVRALAPGGLSGQSSADVAKGCINQATSRSADRFVARLRRAVRLRTARRRVWVAVPNRALRVR